MNCRHILKHNKTIINPFTARLVLRMGNILLTSASGERAFYIFDKTIAWVSNSFDSHEKPNYSVPNSDPICLPMLLR